MQGKFSLTSSPAQLEQEASPKPNHTGLPDHLKSGIESLSGLSMDEVKVHYHSSQPAQLNALAYAQGTDIHLAPGQEQHLPHEAWHVVQQAQGRVKPTTQMKEGVPINDDRGLEHEADVMGERALQQKGRGARLTVPVTGRSAPLAQRYRPSDFSDYEEAKDANPYSREYLDTQKGDTLDTHIGKEFSGTERNNIYTKNIEENGGDDIHSDIAPYAALYLQDTSTTPHVDHRYPKSKGGSNSFSNAAVIPADKNIAKSDKLELEEEPKDALDPYASLDDGDYVIGVGRNFNDAQKKEIYDANRKYYREEGFDLANDEAMSDDPNDDDLVLSGHDSSQVPNVDHITPRSDHGTNYYFNAQVLPADENIQKGGVRKKLFTIDMEEDTSSSESEPEFEEEEESVGKMKLETYYKWK
ncbi:MAG: DUF4157 domain-containing protein, partial [Methylococcaceae bacterium]|nr:DUF4157 domain-containing protein [Methylococcaceae bacterium]